MLSEDDFKNKYLQHSISFLSEENLDKLETHCRKVSKIERGIEHKVVLELLDRYYRYQKEIQDKNNKITKLQKENEEKDKEILNLKNEINKAWEEWNDLEQGSYEEEIRLKEEIKKKDKQIDLMGLAILNYDDQLVINRYKDIDEVKETFKDLAKEKRE